MRLNQIEGNWKPFDGNEIQDKLTTDETKTSAGRREIPLGKRQERFRAAQDKAKEQDRYSGKTVSGCFFIF